jgi:hypothetical protein
MRTQRHRPRHQPDAEARDEPHPLLALRARVPLLALRACVGVPSLALRACVVAVVWVLAGGVPGQAAPPKTRGWLDPLRYRDVAAAAAASVRHAEAIDMLAAIWQGSMMGPGEGWFRPGEGRYSWRWLADRCDADHDGKITRAEFKGPAELFDRLDRDHDGLLTADDFDWSERSGFLRQSDLAERWFRTIDRDSNGRLTRAEWNAFFEKMAKGRDSITPEELREALYPPQPALPAGKAPPGMPTPLLLTVGLFKGEVGSPFSGPSVGQKAPDFTLRAHDAKGEVNLTDYRGNRPAVLIFGSFT